jgi:hypothetical protein
MFAGSASAVIDLDANIAGIFTDSTFGTPVPGAVIDPSGDEATVNLAAGQAILITLDVSNLNGDFVTDLFSTIIIEGSQLNYLGGNYDAPTILVGGPVFMQTNLGAIGSPSEKVNSPNANGTSGPVWIQSTAYASTGTDGTGPNNNIASLFFLVTGASGTDQILFDLTTTTGDVISGSPTLSGAVINPIPEPGTALLMGLGLAGLAAAGRRNA